MWAVAARRIRANSRSAENFACRCIVLALETTPGEKCVPMLSIEKEVKMYSAEVGAPLPTDLSELDPGGVEAGSRGLCRTGERPVLTAN